MITWIVLNMIIIVGDRVVATITTQLFVEVFSWLLLLRRIHDVINITAHDNNIIRPLRYYNRLGTSELV